MSFRVRRLAAACGLILAAARPGAAGVPVTAPLGNSQLDVILQALYTSDQAPNANDAFSIQRAEIYLSGRLNERVSYQLMVDPSDRLTLDTTANSSGTLTSVSVDHRTTALKDAFITLKPVDGIFFQVGQFRVPFGREGTMWDADVESAVRGAISTDLGWSDYYDQGVLGSVLKGPFKLQLGVFNGEGANTLDKNDTKDVFGRLVWDPWDSFSMGVSAYNGAQFAARRDTEHYGADIEWKPGDATLRAEAASGTGGPAGVAAVFQRKETYYILAALKVEERWQPYVRFDYFDLAVDSGGNCHHDITVGLNWLLQGNNARLGAEFVRRNLVGNLINYNLGRVSAQLAF